MNRRDRTRARTRARLCLIGLLVSVILAGAVWVAMRRAVRQAVVASYTPLTGAAEWEGAWEFSELGADPSEAGTERVTIRFTGTDLALQVRRGDYRGNLFISVDGQPANRLPHDGENAYLVLTSPQRTPQVVTIPVATGLDDGPHVAVLVADRGWDQWPLASWSVSRTPDMAPYHWTLTALVALALGCLAGAAWWSRKYGVGSRGQEAGGRKQEAGSKGQEAEEKRQEAGGKTQEAGGKRQEAGGGECLVPPNLQSPISNLNSQFSILLAATLISASAFYLSPWLPLTLVSFLLLAGLILLRLDLGLALVAATVPFYRYPRPLLGRAFSMAEILTLLCALSWGLRMLARWGTRLRMPTANRRKCPVISNLQSAICNLQSRICNLQSPISNLDLAALLFVLIAIVSLFVTQQRHVALRELRVVVLEPALFYLMLRTGRLGKQAFWRVVDFFVLGAVVVAVIGLVQYGLGINVITAEEGFRRLRSVYGSPNNAGLYLGRVLPVVVALAVFGAARRRRVAYGLAAVLVGLAVLLSFSKGAIILGVPLSLVALGLLAGKPWSWASLGAVAAAALAAVPLLRTPRFASLLDTHSGTTFFRLHLWRSSWMMLRDHPWLGVGLDNFLYQYRSRYILPAAWQEPDLSHPHNVLLDYGTRLGLFGLAAGAWLQVAFWRLALPLRRRAGSANGPAGRGLGEAADRRALVIGLMGSMVDFLAHGMVDASYFVIDLAYVFFLTLGLVQWLARSEIDGFEN
jgi:O-antigen ligase